MGFSSSLQRLPQIVYLGEGVGQFIHGGGSKQDESRGNIFSKMENTKGITQGDNSPGQLNFSNKS